MTATREVLDTMIELQHMVAHSAKLQPAVLAMLKGLEADCNSESYLGSPGSRVVSAVHDYQRAVDAARVKVHREIGEAINTVRGYLRREP